MFCEDTCACLSRFDFFHRTAGVPMLEDYNDYGSDDAIEFLADLMQLVAAQFPELSKADLQNPKTCPKVMKPYYSIRIHLWKVPQKNAYVRCSFNKHTKAQCKAQECGDTKRASLESKLKNQAVSLQPGLGCAH